MEKSEVNVVKRDGSIEGFDQSKIERAISRACAETKDSEGAAMASAIADKAFSEFSGKIKNNSVGIEDIQDGVELALIDTGHKQTALAYARYRERHAQMRKGLDYGKLVDEYLNQSDWRVKENATVNFSLGGLILSNSGAVTANYWLNDIYDKEIADAHRNADLHIHDLSMLSPYCFTGDTRIKTLDGKHRSFKELVDGKIDKIWVFAFDTEKGCIVPALAENPRITRKCSELIKITLSSNRTILCTPDHPFLVRDGRYVAAKDLHVNMSLMPLYIGEKSKYVSINNGWYTGDESRAYLHRWVAESILGRSLSNDEVVHHKDGDKHNNTPDNICVMKDADHRRMELAKTVQTELWKTSNHERLEEYNRSDEKRSQISEFASNRERNSFGQFEYVKEKDANGAKYNHRIRRIERISLDEPIDVYDITVPKYNNFALDAGIFVHNCAGWSLKQLIQEGLGGVQGKINSTPAGHLSTLVNQMVNFIGVMQNEWAGAMAFSSFDTYLAPFVKKDNLTYKEVKQCIQSFIFGVNTPSRWGCVDKDTEVLSVDGWKKYDQLKKGDVIYTWKDGEIRTSVVNEVVVKEHHGKLHVYEGKGYAQTVTPEHRVLCRIAGESGYAIHRSHDVFGKECEFPGASDSADAGELVGWDCGKGIATKTCRSQSEIDDAQEYALARGFVSHVEGSKVVVMAENKNISCEKQTSVDYDGIVWCPNDDDGTAVFRRNGFVFISGQCQAPFSNVTIDWKIPADLKDLPAIVGGKNQDFTYGDCQKEADMVNKAFIEVMIEGDADGRGFQYPIPTYSITKDFDWSDTENNKLLFEMAAKYGIPYFSNYINSDMNPSDVRSMALLSSEELIYKDVDSGVVSKNEIRHLVHLWQKDPRKDKYQMLINGQFRPITEMFEIDYSGYKNKYSRITLANKYVQDFSLDHKCAVVRDGKMQIVMSQDVVPGDYFLLAKKGYDESSIGTYELGKVVGYYIANGWHSHGDSEIDFAINIKRKDIVDEIVRYFETNGCRVRFEKQDDVNIYKVFVFGQMAGALVSQFVTGNKATEKHLTAGIFNMSLDFRRGVYDGYYDTDGCPTAKNFANTTNKLLTADFEQFAATIGRYFKYSEDKNNTRYFKPDKSDLVRFTSYKLDCIQPESFNDDYYMIPVKDNTTATASAKITHVYNFTIDTPEHLFTLPNGIISHQCCRLRLSLRDLRKRNGGFFGSGDATGSVAVVSINMPRIGYLAADKDDFYKRLDHMMDIAARSLEIKRKVVTDLYNQGLYPYTKRYLGDVAYHNHFSTIGLVGMNEACLNAKWLKDDLTHKDAQDFTVEVLNHMRNRLSDYQVQYPSTLFNLEATPAESTCVSGDTNVWTDKGRMTVNDIIADKNKNIGIMSFNAETNSVEFKKLVDCWKTKKDAEVMKITFSNGDSVKVTPNHKMAKRFVTGCGPSRKCWIDYVEAGSLKVGDRLFACHVYTKNSKAYGETYRNVECVLGKNKGSFPMHRLLAEYYYGKIPDGFVVHHKDFDKTNNAKDNLEIMSDADHRRLHEHDEGRNFVRCVDGSANPFFGKHHTEKSKELISETKRETKDEWYPKFLENMASEDTRRKMSEGNKKKSFEQYSRYMPECSTEAIIAKWKENKSIGEIAKELGEPYTYSLVKSRLKHAGLLPNHQIVKIEYLTEREDVYDLEVEGNHNFFISGGVDDAVLVHNCFRLAKHDKEMYPDIITAGKSGETPYYTNSSHLPVGYTDDMFSALDVEDRFQTLYTSGTVFHAFLGQRLPDWHSCMRLVRKIAENYKLPYFTMSPTYSICPDHGYIVGEKWKCPICGKETEVYSRITGYYRPLKNWNAGKMQEFHDRKEYDSSKEEVHDGCNACSLENKNISAEAPKVDHLMLFTNPTCPNCKMAKMLLDKAGIKYDNIDASTHLDQVNAFGITAAPTMIVPDGASFDVYRNASEIAGWIKSRSNA